MERKFKEIRERYAKGGCGVAEDQMCYDLRSLLDYIEQLHLRLIDQAAEEAVQAVFLSLGDGADSRVH